MNTELTMTKNICGQIKLPFQGVIVNPLTIPKALPWARLSLAFSQKNKIFTTKN